MVQPGFGLRLRIHNPAGVCVCRVMNDTLRGNAEFVFFSRVVSPCLIVLDIV